MLTRLGQERNGTWACTLSADEEPALCATAEALIALSRSRGDRALIRSGVRNLQNICEDSDSGTTKRIGLWAISELIEHATQRQVREAAALAAQEWDIYEDRDDDIQMTKYFTDLKQDEAHQAYYSYDVRLLFPRATLAFVMQGALDEPYFRKTLPIVSDIANRILKNGGFYTSGKGLQFWQHYQAMDVLSTFIRVVSRMSHLLEEVYVLVKPVHFHKHAFTTDSELAVVLMPFGKRWSDDVWQAFQKTVTKNGFLCWRSDKEVLDDQIIQTIWEHVNKARFVIADCTGKNPNVFYELGIADTIGKPVFRCAQKREDFPFDISGIRSHVYETLPNGIDQLKKQLNAFITAIARKGEVTK